MQNRPKGITIIAIIFFFLSILSLIIGISIIIPNTPLDVLWTLKNSFPSGFRSTPTGITFGYFLILLGLIIFSTGYGLLKGRKWAWWIAIILLAANMIAGVVSLALGNFQEIVGIFIVGGFLFYLNRLQVRAFFEISNKQKLSQGV